MLPIDRRPSAEGTGFLNALGRAVPDSLKL